MKELELEKVIMYKRQPVKTDKEEMDQFKFWFDPSEDSNESWTFRTVQWKLHESLRQATQKKNIMMHLTYMTKVVRDLRAYMDGITSLIAKNIANQELMIKRFDIESKLLKQSNLEMKDQLKLNGLEMIGKEIKEMYETKLKNFLEYQTEE